MAPEEAENMRAMVDIQWAFIQIAAMSGAAGSADFLIEPEEEDPNEFWARFYTGRLGGYHEDLG